MNGYGTLDSIETLKIDTNGNESDWRTYGTPHPLSSHTMTLLRNEIVFIGGYEAWKGIIQGNDIRFEQLPSMKNKRFRHFAFAIKGNIVVFGGEENTNIKIEKYDPITKQWTDGPLLPCYLSNEFDNAVMNRQGKIILMTNKKGIGIFDPEKNSVEFF